MVGGDRGGDEWQLEINATGLIVTKNYQVDADLGQIKMTNMTDLAKAVNNLVNNNISFELTFQLGPTDTPIYSFTADSNNLNISEKRLIYNDIEGNNMIRCIFSIEECLVTVRNANLDENLLKNLLREKITMTLEVNDRIDKIHYTNTGSWTQYDSGSWTKYRKDN